MVFSKMTEMPFNSPECFTLASLRERKGGVRVLLFGAPSPSPPRNVVERETYLEFELIATSARSSELD